jgi:hypothetical protein
MGKQGGGMGDMGNGERRDEGGLGLAGMGVGLREVQKVAGKGTLVNEGGKMDGEREERDERIALKGECAVYFAGLEAGMEMHGMEDEDFSGTRKSRLRASYRPSHFIEAVRFSEHRSENSD